MIRSRIANNHPALQGPASLSHTKCCIGLLLVTAAALWDCNWAARLKAYKVRYADIMLGTPRLIHAVCLNTDVLVAMAAKDHCKVLFGASKMTDILSQHPSL